MDEIGGLETQIAQLANEIEFLKNQLTAQANEISAERRSQADPLCDFVKQILTKLSMSDAEMQIEFVKEERLGPNGFDNIQFLFKTNKGGQFLPLKKVASGGELSRIMLAIKKILSDNTKLPTIIFDEIDTGVSGEISNKIAHIMQQMAKNMQVITITHLPQIAAMGRAHFRVRKLRGEAQTLSTIERLSEDERITEISEMIGGQEASNTAMESAKELLQKFAGTFY